MSLVGVAFERVYHRNQPNMSKLAMYKPLLYCNRHLKQLYILYVSNKTEQFSYKIGCGIIYT